ncbi:hypothetical protein CHLRE_12g552952v5 [Chlamydomonas reinhardtii]|uniref:Uncharacterized protein n=1 Tax=Chlamydomonas reinhardtii TaxID=3055 RepID=A0A2K3D612_CHLRE|nr:uncharacterized protein CHLRE_12g552952v5 [Chlamydomonas reinhardtii]PNW75969.1 hypothetical protein CHLRE_12g552952v5 [Chlamydomonas reinhardtii]
MLLCDGCDWPLRCLGGRKKVPSDSWLCPHYTGRHSPQEADGLDEAPAAKRADTRAIGAVGSGLRAGFLLLSAGWLERTAALLGVRAAPWLQEARLAVVAPRRYL